MLTCIVCVERCIAGVVVVYVYWLLFRFLAHFALK